MVGRCVWGEVHMVNLQQAEWMPVPLIHVWGGEEEEAAITPEIGRSGKMDGEYKR